MPTGRPPREGSLFQDTGGGCWCGRGSTSLSRLDPGGQGGACAPVAGPQPQGSEPVTAPVQRAPLAGRHPQECGRGPGRPPPMPGWGLGFPGGAVLCCRPWEQTGRPGCRPGPWGEGSRGLRAEGGMGGRKPEGRPLPYTLGEKGDQGVLSRTPLPGPATAPDPQTLLIAGGGELFHAGKG